MNLNAVWSVASMYMCFKLDLDRVVHKESVILFMWQFMSYTERLCHTGIFPSVASMS
jgi:hypothetical protein